MPLSSVPARAIVFMNDEVPGLRRPVARGIPDPLTCLVGALDHPGDQVSVPQVFAGGGDREAQGLFALLRLREAPLQREPLGPPDPKTHGQKSACREQRGNDHQPRAPALMSRIPSPPASNSM